jgi:hypothetical protein
MQLLVDNCSIIGECGLVLLVLAEVAVLLHVDLVANLLESSAFFVRCLHLRIEVIEVIAKAAKGCAFEVLARLN